MPKAEADATTTRRRVLGAAGLLLAAPIAAAAAPAHPDARLIRLCSALIRAERAFDDDQSPLEPEENPLWRSIERIEGELEGVRAATLDGVVAKARVALLQARLPSGKLDFSPSYTGTWPEQVVRDLLRLHP